MKRKHWNKRLFEWSLSAFFLAPALPELELIERAMIFSCFVFFLLFGTASASLNQDEGRRTHMRSNRDTNKDVKLLSDVRHKNRGLSQIEVYPPCGLGEDTTGRWVYPNETSEAQLRRHFYHGRPHASTDFTKIWLPDRCAYHRFTPRAIKRSVEYVLYYKLLLMLTF